MKLKIECWYCREYFPLEDRYCPLCFAVNENWNPKMAEIQRSLVTATEKFEKEHYDEFEKMAKKYFGLE